LPVKTGPGALLEAGATGADRDIAGARSRSNTTLLMPAPALVLRPYQEEYIERLARIHAARCRALLHCGDVRHPEKVAGAFRDAGYRAAGVYGSTSVTDRDRLIAGLVADRFPASPIRKVPQ
jgi:superfamily II DNA or RNA helicase